MKIAPAYDGSTRLVMDVGVAGVGAALTRQRRRFDAMVRGLDAAQWSHPSRCAEWTVRDVVAHLVGVNRFWAISVRSGVAGAPTRFLEHFDPAAVPRQMVAAMRDLGIDDLLAQHAAANAELLDAIAQLGPDDWEALAESPAGHVPVWSVAHHALWDCWVHERDIALPLGLAVPGEPDELAACLRYCAGIGAVLTLGSRAESAAVYGIVATEPDLALRIDVDDSVCIIDAPAPSAAPCLSGTAVELVEALSIRTPLPAGAPPEWRVLAGALADVFDTELAS